MDLLLFIHMEKKSKAADSRSVYSLLVDVDMKSSVWAHLGCRITVVLLVFNASSVDPHMGRTFTRANIVITRGYYYLRRCKCRGSSSCSCPSSNRIRAGKQTLPHRADMCRSSAAPAPWVRVPLPPNKKRGRMQPLPPHSLSLWKRGEGPCYTIAVCQTDALRSCPPFSVPVIRSVLRRRALLRQEAHSEGRRLQETGRLCFQSKVGGLK